MVLPASRHDGERHEIHCIYVDRSVGSRQHRGSSEWARPQAILRAAGSRVLLTPCCIGSRWRERRRDPANTRSSSERGKEPAIGDSCEQKPFRQHKSGRSTLPRSPGWTRYGSLTSCTQKAYVCSCWGAFLTLTRCVRHVGPKSAFHRASEPNVRETPSPNLTPNPLTIPSPPSYG